MLVEEMLLLASVLYYVTHYLVVEKCGDLSGDYDVARYKDVDEVWFLEFYAEQIFKR